MNQQKDRIRSKIIGHSPALLEAIQKLERAAGRHHLPIVLLGETGTGKELAAKLIHAITRPNEPFVPINCGAISKELMMSECFGHVKGAFTGAIRDRRGVFEQAHGGVLFLDEIGEMPLDLQVKLLRVLQDREIQRVGSEKTICVDVRIVAATNKDLKGMVKKGTFREDLYFRLKGLTVTLPPLRERGNDVLLLADHFLKSIDEDKCFSLKSMQLLRLYQWPGNIRELENVIVAAEATADCREIEVDHLLDLLESDGLLAGVTPTNTATYDIDYSYSSLGDSP
ncbi:MAG: sigma-54 dependent transcriptional regulator [Myxococcota bacterium]|nr:sigma-54 dependent transcriptional regulator [Myxococcota bacterium]